VQCGIWAVARSDWNPPMSLLVLSQNYIETVALLPSQPVAAWRHQMCWCWRTRWDLLTWAACEWSFRACKLCELCELCELCDACPNPFHDVCISHSSSSSCSRAHMRSRRARLFTAISHRDSNTRHTHAIPGSHRRVGAHENFDKLPRDRGDKKERKVLIVNSL
jgi:hypothetical protein